MSDVPDRDAIRATLARMGAELEAQIAACQRMIDRLDDRNGGVRVPVDRTPPVPPEVAHADVPLPLRFLDAIAVSGGKVTEPED
jgi:hypothetical protein